MKLYKKTSAELMRQGLTPQEIAAFESTVDCACAVLALPDIHPMDRGEYCSAFHVIQDKLLARAATGALLPVGLLLMLVSIAIVLNRVLP